MLLTSNMKQIHKPIKPLQKLSSPTSNQKIKPLLKPIKSITSKDKHTERIYDIFEESV